VNTKMYYYIDIKIKKSSNWNLKLRQADHHIQFLCNSIKSSFHFVFYYLFISEQYSIKKMLPTIWGTYMKLVTKYQISAINSCWEKCDEKCAYMFNVYRNQQSQQTGSRNLTGPKSLPTIWHTYMKLVTKYQIPVINSCWEKCNEKCAYTNVC
jgi:hypothetical protein